ncbi:hypothetical protein SAMN02745246_00156 [Leeuwenhoekiella marinoflava DSM 3653]|uniref:Uncharacterized protein n=3 Tax=Leeuwenhoekiella marinoflava TaxID=988 RepID=A0A4Q0PR19_9FLAO|nr:hypothetical protein DSL99_96 [Leeuwenhoekiella marinoflava]SHE35131.1 hypothetical protein SAMN02745246_00156 [Leeuwenhoekiella marinoflava DSM 3653]
MLLSSFLLLLSSCGSVSRTLTGNTEKTMIKTVSVEQGCEVKNIKLLDKVKTWQGATYSLDVCGTRMVYKQVGSVFMESGAAEKMKEDLQNKN